MKLTIKKETLEKAVKHICRVINDKAALPILSNILCEVDPDPDSKSIKLTGSDSEVWLTMTLILESAEGGGRFCVSAWSLMEALQSLSDQPITIIADIENENPHFELQHATGRTYFPIENADEYPVQQDLEDIITMSMPAEELARAISVTSFAATVNDELRPIMNGICFDTNNERTDIVASNGHVLMRYRIKQDYGVTGNFVLPRKVANILPKMLTWADDDDAWIEWNDRSGRVEQNADLYDWVLTFRLIDGKYPNYESVIPKDTPFWVTADRSQLINSIRKVAPFTPDASNMIIASFKGAELTIDGEDADFGTGATDMMAVEPCDNMPESLTIGLKASSIISILSKMPYDNILIRMTDPSRAVTFEEKPVPGTKCKMLGDITGLSMPMIYE